MSSYLPCIAYDEPEFAHFCSHVNARLCVNDFIEKTRQLGVKGYNPNALATLVLPIRHDVAVKPLFDSDYATLIKAVCNRITITSHAIDSFRSELDDQSLAFFIDTVAIQSQQVTVKFDHSWPAFVLTLPDLLSDLVLAPISQLNTAVVENCGHFAGMINAVGGDPKRLFLNAKTSSAFSMFILTWVANRMDVPLTFGDNNTMVGVI